MYKIEVHNRVNQIMSLLHVSGIWQDDNRFGFRKWFARVMQLILCVYYPVALAVASRINDNKVQSVFQAVAAIAASVQAARAYYFFWNKDQIIELVRTLGTHIIRRKELNQLYSDVNSTIKRFVSFASIFPFMILCEGPMLIISALISNGRHLPLNLYFPLNWKESDFAYWFAFVFISLTLIWYSMLTLLNVVVWYLMMSGATKYEILGNELRLTGVVSTKETLVEKQRIFVEEFIEFIRNHQVLQDTTDKFVTTFSNLFFIQIITSGLTICGSAFTLAFLPFDDPFVFIIYFFAVIYFSFEIFMVTYLGNEIKLWSSRLSYCLFKCDWLDQSKSSKKCMIILMEVLKRPQLLIIGKMYALDLEIFTKILKFTYSMFNVLLSFK